MDSVLTIKRSLVTRVQARRKEQRLSQQALAKRSGVSFGSIKRFERFGEISLASLLRLAQTLGCEKDFDYLFQEHSLPQTITGHYVISSPDQEHSVSLVWA